MNDPDIIKSVLAGEVDAYAELVQAHQAKVRLTCLAYLSNASEADDAAQDVFIKAYEKLASFKGEASFGTWISHIAANHCRDLLRTHQRHKTESLDALVEEKGDHLQALLQRSPEQPQTPEDLELLGRLFASIPEEEREILLLREVQELPYDEIASKLRCSLDAVKGRLKRARQRLIDKCRTFLDTSSQLKRP